MMKLTLVTIFFSVILSACATTQEQACPDTDWYELGRRQGAQGRSAEEFSHRFASCNEEREASSQRLFQNGYNAGLVDYCSPDNGFYLGLNQYAYNQVCPATLEDEFVAEYQRGVQAYQLQQANQEIDQKIDSIFEELNQASLSKGQRTSLQTELSQLKRARARNQRQLVRIQKSYN